MSWAGFVEWLTGVTNNPVFISLTTIFSTLGVPGNDAFVLIQKAMQATGVDSDKAADMVKEFFLTLTDGSKTRNYSEVYLQRKDSKSRGKSKWLMPCNSNI